jgi:hypothetical protein
MAEPGDMGAARVTFGASAYRAVAGAAWQAHRGSWNIIGTDQVVRALLHRPRRPDAEELVDEVHTLEWPVSYGYRPSLAGDGQQPVRSYPDYSSEVEATLREVTWGTVRFDRRPTDEELSWTNGLRVVLHEALVEAHSAGVARTHAAHLIYCALADEANGAVRLFPESYPYIVKKIRQSPLLAKNGEPYPNMDELASQLRPNPPHPRRRRLARWAYARVVRLVRLGMLLSDVENGQRRQAVRLGHHTITVAHVLLALIDTDDRLAAFDLRLPADLAARNTAARRLLQCGLTFDHIHLYASRTGDDVELEDPETLIGRLENTRWGDPLWSRTVTAAYKAATDIALAHRHPDAGTTHLLAGLLAEARSELTDLVGDLAELDSLIADDLAHIEQAWSA